MSDVNSNDPFQAVLDEICADIPPFETAMRERVASRLRELAAAGRYSIDDLRRAGRDALERAPTMWPGRGVCC